MTALKERATIIDALGTSLSYGGQALSAVPDLLRRVLEEEAWREFVTKLGEHVTHERFEEFVTAPPLAGLGANLRTLESICRDDPEALRELRKATTRRKGRPEKNHNMSIKPRQGTGKAYILDRLERERPDLHELVLNGKASARAAGIAAGFVPRTATVPIDDPERLAATLRRRLTPDALDRLRELLG